MNDLTDYTLVTIIAVVLLALTQVISLVVMTVLGIKLVKVVKKANKTVDMSKEFVSSLRQRQMKSSSLGVGLVMGGVGLLAGLLLAPKSGRETRAQLANRVN